MINRGTKLIKKFGIQIVKSTNWPINQTSGLKQKK